MYVTMTGQEFKRWRKIHHMTQEQAGTLFGVMQRTVGAWELRDNAVPPLVIKIIALIDEDANLLSRFMALQTEQ